MRGRVFLLLFLYGGENMKIKITQNVAGINFAYKKGDEVNVEKALASDLIKANYAISMEKETATKKPKETRKKVTK